MAGAIAAIIVAIAGGAVGLGGVWFVNKQINTIIDLFKIITPQHPITYIVLLCIVFVFCFFVLKRKAGIVFAFMIIPTCLFIIGLEKSIIKEYEGYKQAKLVGHNEVYTGSKANKKKQKKEGIFKFWKK